MLKLFLVPPEGKGKQCWFKHGKVGGYCSNPQRGPFYVSMVKSSESNLGKLLWLLGGAISRFAVRLTGAPGSYAARRFVARMELRDTDGDSPVGEGILAAKALLPGIQIALIDGSADLRHTTKNKTLCVGLDYKCDPELFAQQAVFLYGFWGAVNEI